MICSYSGDKESGYKYNYTVNITAPLINLIRYHPDMELTMPILDCNKQTLFLNIWTK